MIIPDAELDEMERRANAATEGPWESESTKSEGSYGVGDETHEGYEAFEIRAEIRGKWLSIADSLNAEEGEVHEDFGDDYSSAWDEIARRNFNFIANARIDLPRLITEVRTLKAALGESLKAMEMAGTRTEYMVRACAAARTALGVQR